MDFLFIIPITIFLALEPKCENLHQSTFDIINSPRINTLSSILYRMSYNDLFLVVLIYFKNLLTSFPYIPSPRVYATRLFLYLPIKRLIPSNLDDTHLGFL